MAFTDEITIYAKAGDGGPGVVRWLHEKGKEFMGPAGGNGGKGGSVYVVARRNLNILAKYKAEKKFLAQNGGAGQGRSMYGENGKDLDIELPVGSIVTNLRTGAKISLSKEGDREMILKGGGGGKGNEYFKNSTNVTPEESTKGYQGESDEFYIEVELIADIGLIGFPNAGKTSLLNELSASKGKVGDYPFTTLEPNLGEMYGYIIADIPGLIEGASDGKGLGHKFLRHIRRTKVLVHLVSAENENIVEAYNKIRNELGKFDEELLKKKEIVVLTKTDVINDKDIIKKTIKDLEKVAGKVAALTIYDDANIKSLQDLLIKELSQ